MVQSLQRAIDIMEMVAGMEEGARLTDIAENLNLKKTTAHNLLRTLQYRGYLEKDYAHRFQIGPAIEEISRNRYRRSIFQRVTTQIRQLHKLFPDATITFSELVGNEIICRLRLAPDMPGVLRHPHAQTFCPFGSASGLCLQAFNPNYRENLSSTSLFEESGHRFWADRQSFEQALRDTTTNGLAEITGESIRRLAAPAGENHTLGMSMKTATTDETILRERLRTTAAAIAAE